MKTRFKKFLCAVTAFSALLLMPFSAHAENETEEKAALPNTPELVEGETVEDGIIVYTKARGGGVYVTSCTKSVTSLTILDSIDGYPIYGIYDSAFAGVDSLRSITLSEGVNYIGTGAFYDCPKLTEVNLPEGVTQIPDFCFNGCTGLKSVTLPESVKSVGAHSFANSGIDSFTVNKGLESIGVLAFVNCRSLKEFSVADGNTKYQAENGILYSNNKTVLEAHPANNGATEFEVPEAVTYIQPGAFFGSPTLLSVSMGDNVETLGDMAFQMCSSLNEVTLSSSIKEIGDGTFCDCSSLRAVDIPEAVTKIGDSAFFGCGALKTLALRDTVESIGEYAVGFTDDKGAAEIHELKDFEITGASYDSAAGKYARKNNIGIDYTDRNKKTPLIIIGVSAAALIIAAIIIIAIKKKSPSQ